jgi:hypothetical protein
MMCSICSKVAFYIAGKKGFCGDHRAQAVEATAQDKRRILSRMGVGNTGEASGLKSKGAIRPWRGWNFNE